MKGSNTFQDPPRFRKRFLFLVFCVFCPKIRRHVHGSNVLEQNPNSFEHESNEGTPWKVSHDSNYLDQLIHVENYIFLVRRFLS